MYVFEKKFSTDANGSVERNFAPRDEAQASASRTVRTGRFTVTDVPVNGILSTPEGAIRYDPDTGRLGISPR